MISSLRGKVSRIYGNFVEIDVGGVGYEIFVGNNFLKKHFEGEVIRVQTYLAVSENDMKLYGFDSFEELDLFKMMITVSGVGPKTAAQILGGCNNVELIKAIGDADVKFFEKVKGVGKKTAQRIIVDLKSKIGGLGEINLKDEITIVEDDVTLSLQSLGFDKKEMERVFKLMPQELVTTEEKLSWCLQNLGR